MEPEGREQAGDAVGHAARRLDERVVLGHVGARKDVEPAPDAVERAAPVEPGERLAGDPERGEVLRTEDAARAGEVEEAVGVRHESSVIDSMYRRNVTRSPSRSQLPRYHRERS